MEAFRRGSAATFVAVWAAATIVVGAAALLDLAASESGADTEHYAFDWPIPAGLQYPPPQHQHNMHGASSPPPYKEATPHHYPLAPHTIVHGGTGLAPPVHRLLKAVVVGHVLCRGCHERRPLSGARVAVSCWSKHSEESFYGTTNGEGLYRVELVGFDYEKYGGNACRAKLVGVPEDSKCAMPPPDGRAEGPAHLHIKSKSEYEVVLFSKTFKLISCEAGESKPSPSHGYYHYSPPPAGHYHRADRLPSPPHSWSLPPPHSADLPLLHSPPPYYSHSPHHEYSPPRPPSHEHVLPSPDAVHHLYSPPASYPYYKHAYPPPAAQQYPETHTPPAAYDKLAPPPYKYESPPPHPPHDYHENTHPPPLQHDLTPPSSPYVYHSPPLPLPPSSYKPTPVTHKTDNPAQSTGGHPTTPTQETPTSTIPIPSFHKNVEAPPSS